MAADESQKQERSYRWSKEEGWKSSFCVTDGSLSSQEFGVRASISKSTKAESYSRGDIVKDDSGSYAVFIEQGSSASQMTADKIMDTASQLLRCASQAAEAVSAKTQAKMEDAPTLSKIPVRVSRYLDTSAGTQIAKILVQCGRPSCSSWTKSVRFFNRTIVGTAIRESSIKNTVGKKFQIGNVYSLTEKKDYSYLCMWTI